MKGLWKCISPFAPDQSGATAVLCEMGGLIVIIDAGGCAGNICGFDEPRWFEKKSAIFSAGLRDMDAILGRDDRLVEKVAKVCEKIDGNFVALIGTPVPAVIGTDYKALRRMIEVKTGIPVLTMNTSGVRYYDEGSEKAWLELFENFTEPSMGMEANVLGVLGATPFDANMDGFDVDGRDKDAFAAYFPGFVTENERKVFVYGMGSGIEEVKKASTAAKNLVVAPSALKAARYLAKRFGVPYETGYPLATIKGYAEFLADIKEKTASWKEEELRFTEEGRLRPRKILVCHQQVLADSLRKELAHFAKAQVVVADWFEMDKELRAPWDVPLKEEDQWISLVENGDFDMIIGDEILKKAVPSYQGVFYGLNHFAVSGKPLEFILPSDEKEDKTEETVDNRLFRQ